MNTATDTSQTEGRPSSKRSRRRFNKAMKITRRVHMYLGLGLVPWVILFGISGFLFNHTSSFWGGNWQALAPISPAEAQESAGFLPIDMEQFGSSLLERINTDSDANYTLKGSPWLSSHLRLSGEEQGKEIRLNIDPRDGSTEVLENTSSNPEQDRPDFDGKEFPNGIQLPDTIAERFASLIEARGIALDNGLELGKNGEIRFVAVDAEGRDWRGAYKLATSELIGVADDSDTQYNFRGAVTRLHKTHHYPDTVGAKWIWVAIADITALSMIIWGVTGLVMWWQIQPTRAIGTLALFVAAVLSFFIFSGTLADYTHNPVQSRSD